GQLDLAIFTRLGLSQDGENLWRQDVATDNRQIGRGFGRRRFFYKPLDSMQSRCNGSRRHDPITVDFRVGHFLYTEDRTVSFFVGMNELREARDRGIADFVAESDRKGFVTVQPLRDEGCTAGSDGRGLPGV